MSNNKTRTTLLKNISPIYKKLTQHKLNTSTSGKNRSKKIMTYKQSEFRHSPEWKCLEQTRRFLEMLEKVISERLTADTQAIRRLFVSSDTLAPSRCFQAGKV